MEIKFRLWTKSKGTGGKIISPEDFVVEEIIDEKFTRKFYRKKGKISKIEGPYTLCILKKRNYTTQEALDIVAGKLGIDAGSIGYAGLKDKFAVTTQYITAKKAHDIQLDGISLISAGKTNRQISIGDLKGNRFFITLHKCRNKKNIGKIIDEIKRRGFPNYFGLQRFGTRKDNHVIGKFLVKREFDAALKMINKNCSRMYSGLTRVSKKRLKFFIHAYQSWIFNEAMNMYISKRTKPVFSEVPVAGYNTKFGKCRIDKIILSIMKREGIKKEDFCINELRILCSGGHRNAFIKPDSIQYQRLPYGNDVIAIQFELPKGSYATILTKEITKWGQ